MRRILALTAGLLGTVCCWAQVQITKIEKSGEKGERVIITYDITDSNADNHYDLGLYASTDNYSKPLSLLSGDIGNSLLPGKGKRIEWRAKEELGEYKGKLSVEIRGRMTTVALAIKDFNSGSKFKKGKTYTINWVGGNSSDQFDLELLNGENKVDGYTGISNTGSHSFTIPKDATPGAGYRVRLKDTKSSRALATNSFEVVKGSKKGLIIIPILAVAGGVVVLLASGGKEKETGIELPPEPGN